MEPTPESQHFDLGPQAVPLHEPVPLVTAASRSRWRWLAWAIPLAGAAAVAWLFAHFVARYCFLGDDCFISFRYAQNLVAGHGLVYNVGERVEGYTNFLWTLLMAAALWVELPVELVANVLGIACGGAILAVLVWWGGRGGRWTEPWLWIAPLALAVNRTFCGWSTGGLETQCFALLVLSGALIFLRERERNVRVPWGSAACFALAALTRPEGLLFFGLTWLFFACDWLVLRRRTWRALAIWSALFGVVVGAHFLWRYSYYGQWLPNTFYAKVPGLWLDQGAAYLGFFVADHWLVWALPGLVLVVVLRRELGTAYLLVLVLAFAAYLLCIGGDRFEFRFMTPVLPLLFWLLQDGLRALGTRPWRLMRTRVVVTLACVGAAVGLVWCAYRPNTLRYEERRGIAHLENMGAYAQWRTKEGLFLRELVDEGYLRDDTLIAVGGAGALPYYARLPALDFRGLNDLRIAHQPITKRGVIAHEKVATWEYLVERGVVMLDVWNTLVLPDGAPRPRTRSIDRDVYSGPIHCVLAKDRYLVFATTLSDEEFRRVFARFRIMF